MKFTIEAVSKMTGIPAASLRNWEKRYGFPSPLRSDGGHRFYTAKDIDFLKKALLWVDEGQNLNQIALAYKDEMIDCEKKKKIAQEQVQKPEAIDDVSYRQELLYQALLKFDHSSIRQHYAILVAKLSPEQLFDRVFEVTLRRVGKEWVMGKISTAQERFAMAFVRLKLSSFLAIDFPPTQDKRILATTLADEKNEAGLLLISAHLKFRGYRVSYFGCDLPVNALESAIADIKPDVLCLSYARPDSLIEDIPYINEFKVPVCLGGIACFDDQKLALVKANLPEHVHLCEKMTGSEVAQFLEMLCQCKQEE